jgi:hypothetical protein
MNWLLIFDNVDDPKVLGSYWPQGGNGSVILTTRNIEIAHACTDVKLQIEPFSHEEGQSFLLKRAYQAETPSADDILAAAHITRVLGHLPLVLNLTASYIASTRMTFVRFLQLHQNPERSFVFENHGSTVGDTQEYEHSVSTAWTFKFTVMKPESVQLMRLFAILDPDGIPESMFGEATVGMRSVISFPLSVETIIHMFSNPV